MLANARSQSSPLSRLTGGAALSCGALVVGVLLGLFLTPYTVETLGDREYGAYVFASLFAGWCGLLDFGLTTTTSRYITKYYVVDDQRAVDEIGSTAIILFGLIAGLVVALAGVAFVVASRIGGVSNGSGGSETLAFALLFAGVSFGVSKISDGVCGVLRGALRQELTGACALVFRILLGAVDFAVLYCGGRVVALVVANLILTVCQTVVYAAQTRLAVPTFRFSFKNFKRARVKTLFNYGVFAFLAQAGELAVDRSDLLVIATFASMSDVARYNLVVVVLVSYFNSFVREASTWETNWFAKLAASERTTEDEGETFDSENGNSVAKKELARRPLLRAERLSADFLRSRAAIGRASIYWALFLGFGLLAFGRAFVERWIGAEYLDAFPALALCVVANSLYRGSSETNARLLQGLARHRILAFGAILHGVLNVVLSVLFLRAGLGLFGVALGTVLPGVAIWFVAVPLATCRIVGERSAVYWTRQLKTTSTGLVALALPGWLAWRFATPNYFVLGALAGVSAICYWGTLYRFGLTRDERRKIAEFVARRLRRPSNGTFDSNRDAA